jgi:predicted RNase H-like HicB family nuclease
MSESAKYIKIVEWSDEDECFIGYCPGVIGPCCHGDDEVEVYRQLCEIVDELLVHAEKKIDLFPIQPSVGTLRNFC